MTFLFTNQTRRTLNMSRPALLVSLLLSLLISQTVSVSALAIKGAEAAVSTSTKTNTNTNKHYPVFFVTDRKVNQTKHGFDFSNERAATLTYGMEGNTESAELFASEQEYLDKLKATGSSKVAVFTHGYRKSFDGSMETAQQIAQQVNEPVVLFAWPSKNKYSAYMIDECTAEWSSHDFANTLKTVGDEFGNQNVTIIAHSLAVRMVCWSLGILAQSDAIKEPFKSALFFSPDIDRDVFLSDAPLIKRSCSNVKVYIDSHDTRLWLSKVLHGSPRLGGRSDAPSDAELFRLADFDTSMQCHRLTPGLIVAAFSHQDTTAPVAH